VPLFVLVDRRSASAAEDIPFVLQNLGRATIVGERAAGAGRNVGLHRAAHGLWVGVSISQAYDPATGRQWERVGIEPDVAAPSAEALDVALAHALPSLAGWFRVARCAGCAPTLERVAKCPLWPGRRFNRSVRYRRSHKSPARPQPPRLRRTICHRRGHKSPDRGQEKGKPGAL
jgi:hypothetical protein